MNDEKLRLCEQVANILEIRANDPTRSHEERFSYESALSMLRYALAGNAECLAQFDY